MKGANPSEAMDAMERQRRFQDRLRRAGESRERRRRAKAESTRKSKAAALRPEPVNEEHEELREAWYRWPIAAQCEACREKPATEAHHVVRQQHLEALQRDRDYDFETIRWDLANRLLVCADCHEHHTNASRRIHVSCLRPDTLEFIVKYGFGSFLEREYDRGLIERVV